jgi:hypothetical protein
MATYLSGMRGIADFPTGARPENWDEYIHLINPNGSGGIKAFLTALSSKNKKKKVDDYSFHWFEKGDIKTRLVVTAEEAADGTSIAVDTEEGFLTRAGTLCLVEETGEIFLASADGTTTNITTTAALRGYCGTSAAIIPSGSHIQIIGVAEDEGSTVQTAIAQNSTPYENYTQQFSSTAYVSRRAMQTRVYTGDPWLDGKNDAAIQLDRYMEMAFIFGVKSEVAATNGYRTTTSGIREFMPAANKWDLKGSLSWSGWNNFAKNISLYGGQDRIALMGSNAMLALNNLYFAKTQSTSVPTDTLAGMQFKEFVFPTGLRLHARIHPLFAASPWLAGDMLIFDPANVSYCYMQETKWMEAATDTTLIDGKIGRWINDSGIKVINGAAHAYVKGITGFSND